MRITNRISKVVTKTGDQGQTGLVGGERTSKGSARVCAYGDVDELNSFLGWAASSLEGDAQAREILENIQHTLFTVGCDLAAPYPVAVPRVEEGHITDLEDVMEGLMEELPPLEEFILPGGGTAGSLLHVSRTVCRRAERLAVTLAHTQDINPLAIIYLNRLSDFLFVLARVVNRRQSCPETLAQFSQRRTQKAKPAES
jgi:cob(I)alamin adenosyltransferase